MATPHTPAQIDFAAEAAAFEQEGMNDPEFLAAYRDAIARHQLLDALVAERRACSLTQKEVARRMGVKQPTVSGFETEDSDPRLSTLQRYARAVGARVGWKLHGATKLSWCPFEPGPHEGRWRRPDRTEPGSATKNEQTAHDPALARTG